MIVDVTSNWRQIRPKNGIYIVRSKKEGCEEVVRIGAGGVNGGKDGLFGRLRIHADPKPREIEFGTHVCLPYVPIKVWSLPFFGAKETKLAEHCLYRAFAISFVRWVGDRPDNSLFIVPVDFDFTGLLSEVESDIHLISELYATGVA